MSSFFGGDQRKDLRQANAQATAALDKGYGEAQGFNEQAYGELEPYAQRGEAGAAAYSDALGLGTPEGRAKAQASYFDDPAMQAVLGQESNALLRRFNAGGNATGGGKLALAGTRVGLEGYNKYLDRLSGIGTQGAQISTQQAGIRQGQGDLAMGLGQTKAGQSINFGNAMSASRNVGVNNLLGALGVGVKAAKLF